MAGLGAVLLPHLHARRFHPSILFTLLWVPAFPGKWALGGAEDMEVMGSSNYSSSKGWIHREGSRGPGTKPIALSHFILNSKGGRDEEAPAVTALEDGDRDSRGSAKGLKWRHPVSTGLGSPSHTSLESEEP